MKIYLDVEMKNNFRSDEILFNIAYGKPTHVSNVLILAVNITFINVDVAKKWQTGIMNKYYLKWNQGLHEENEIIYNVKYLLN